jgi:outer membrane protein TolC
MFIRTWQHLLSQQIVRARVWSTIAIGAALAAGALSLPARADDRPLTLEEVRRLAVERSPLVVANAASARASREMAVAAGQRPDPVLKLGAINVPIEGADRWTLDRDFMTMGTVALMQEFPSQAKRDARAERSLREAEVADATRAAQAAQVERDAALAWLDRSLQQSVRELLGRQLTEVRLLLPAAEAAYRAGRGPQADVFAAQSADALLQDRIDATNVQIATATTRLTRWIGDAGERIPASRPPMDTAPFDVETAPAHLEHHPAVSIARRQEALANAEVQLAERLRDRDWSLELMYSRRGSAFTDMVSVNVAVPLLWDAGQRQDRELAARLAMREAARAQVEDQLRTQVTEARALRQEWASLRERLARYDASLLPLARQRSDATLVGYRAGTGALAMVLDARRMLLDTEMERLKLEIDAARIWIHLNTLLGTRELLPAEPPAAAVDAIKTGKE